MAQPPAEWHDKDTGELCFTAAWQAVLQTHGPHTAVVMGGQHLTYNELDRLATSLKTSGDYTLIDGRGSDWLVCAIGAWLSKSTVIFFDGELDNPPHTNQSLPPIPELSHALFFTSGTTGDPKPIIRSTEFALSEAWTLAQDLSLSADSTAVCLIKPWFGAMTKHVLGLLLTGVTQRFSLPTARDAIIPEQSALYGTPSQILQTSAELEWHLISITGEYLTQHLADALAERVTDNGYVYDALGSTECGVIARRWLHKAALRRLPQNFTGEPLPGKEIHIDEHQKLSVDAYGSGPQFTGDIASKAEGKIILLGRSSNLRKVHGLWVDATPLLNALRSHSEVIMARLQPRANEIGQPVADVCLAPGASLKALETGLLPLLSDLRLFPQLRHVAVNTELSSTGKARMTDRVIDFCEPERLSDSTAKVLLGHYPVSKTSPIWNTPIESLGLDSLDITELSLSLEREISYPLADQILRSDTLQQIASTHLLHDADPFVFRQLGNASATLEIICLGKSLAHLQEPYGHHCSFQFTPALRAKNKAYTLSGLAQAIIDTNEDALNEPKMRIVVGFSIEALLAAELAYQLENSGVSVTGVFLLDPPDARRQAWLKIRRRLLGSLPQRFASSVHQSQREARRSAIALQPARRLKANTLLLHRADTKLTKSISSAALTAYSIPFSKHKGLVSENEGRAAWRSQFDKWIDEVTTSGNA